MMLHKYKTKTDESPLHLGNMQKKCQVSSHTGASVALLESVFYFHLRNHTPIESYSFHLQNPLSVSPVHSKPSSNADLAVASSNVPVIFSF